MSIPVPDWLINLLSYKIEKREYLIETTNAFDESIAWTAGAITSTATDLAKFNYALFHGELLSDAMLEEMKKTMKSEVFGFKIGLWSGPHENAGKFGPMYQDMVDCHTVYHWLQLCTPDRPRPHDPKHGPTVSLRYIL